MYTLIALHAFALVVCLYREVFDVQVGTIAGFMKMLEVLGIFFFFAAFIQCLSFYSFWSYDITN